MLHVSEYITVTGFGNRKAINITANYKQNELYEFIIHRRNLVWEESCGINPVGGIPWEEPCAGGIPWEESRGRNSVWEESHGRNHVGGILWEESRVGGIPCGRNPLREESHAEGITCGRNHMRGIPWEESQAGGIPCGKIPCRRNPVREESCGRNPVGRNHMIP